MERYIAVDNVCAWPKLTLMSDGSINMDIHNKPSHGSEDGSAVCYKSTDGGRSFEKWGVSGQGSMENGAFIDKACGAAHNGDYLVIVQNIKQAKTFVFRSENGGKDFFETEEIKSGREQKSNHGSMPFPYGKIHKLSGNRLAFSYFMNSEKDWDKGFSDAVHEAHVRISNDDGKTWDEDYLIDYGINETAILFYDDLNAIAIGRASTPQNADGVERRTASSGNKLYRTSDGGKTWQYERDILTQELTPVHLLKLNDGNTLMTYGCRLANLAGVMVSISPDEGRTWKDANFIVNYPPTDNGYPSTVQLDDGTLVTAYYCGGNMYHTRYHAGVIRWHISDLLEGRWVGRPAKFFVGTDDEWINEWR